MELRVDFFQPALVDVSVDLGRGDAGVAEHFLDVTQVGATGQHVRGKTVPQRVRTDRWRDAGNHRVLLDQIPNRFATQALTASRQKNPRDRYGLSFQ